MPLIGNVDKTSEGFLWKIGYLFTLSEGEYYSSPKFIFANHSWYFIIQRDNKSACIHTWLKRFSHGPSIITEYSMSLKSLDGKTVKEHCRCDFKEVKPELGGYGSISIPESFVRERERVVSNVFAVLCILKDPTSIDDKSVAATAQGPYSEETSDFENISPNKKCVNKPIKCPECCDVIPLEKWHDHECQMKKSKGDFLLTQDYKNMLLDGRNHDLILNVGDKKFRAHQDILRARSTVFKSMLDHDMKEKHSGVIDVPDCDPKAMELFLLYVYCGKFETQDQNNMIGLYYIADKYDMQGLKEECSNIIRKSLSNVNICKVIQLAMNHCDSGLLECSTEYFMNNVLGILRTVEWQIFLKENTTVGNELLIKSFEKKK